MWVYDSADQDADLADQDAGLFAPLINGSDTNFSDPRVLTEPGSPMRGPMPWLVSCRLQKFADGTVYDDQMRNNTVGVLP
jgi:hypothetical protein